MRTTRSAVALACIAVLAASCSAPVRSGSATKDGSGTTTTTLAGPPGSAPRASRLKWKQCHGAFRCATLVVPASYSHPGQGTFNIAVIEAPATKNPATAPDIVMNPGGPGVGGVGFLTASVSSFASLRTRFNLVSFDPRGSGASVPIHCLGGAGLKAYLALDPAPRTAAQVRGVVAGAKAFVHSCEQHTPARVLQSVSTADSARDMDRLRAALGEARLNYLGFSYGTYLGALYAEMFPTKVGAFVLDGALDPSLSATADLLQQAQGFETDLHDFFAWCDHHRSCSAGFPRGTKAAFEGLMARLRAGATLQATMTSAYGGRQTVDYGIALYGVISSLYSPSTWKYLGQAMAEGRAGQGAMFLALADAYAGVGPNGQVSNLISADTAINCVDRRWPSSVRAIEALLPRFTKAAPDFGPAEIWGNLPCNYWPVKGAAHFGPVHLARPLPILVVGSTRDPATPYKWAQALSHQLQGSRLLTRRGDGHTGYLASACVRRWVNRYFETMRLPPPGTVCPS
ncbi:MAG: alpha/beta hydrolase [Acidimicrobiales bacterium]